MNIKEISITELKPYSNNPRNNEQAVEKVAESIKQFGFKVPCVIDKNNVIITGHTRYEASKKLGIKKIPCIVADDLSNDQIKAFRLVDNKVSEIATWDTEKLLTEIEDIDLDLKNFDFLDISNEQEIEDFFVDNNNTNKKEEQSETEKTIICENCGNKIIL